MKHTIQAYSIQEAYARLREEFEEQGKTLSYNGFIDISRQITDQRKDPQAFKDLGFLWGYCEVEPGENINKVKFALEHRTVEGTKNWLTKYFVSADYPNVEKPIIIKDVLYYDYKNDADKAAKEWTSETARSSHVMLTKIPDGFYKTQLSVWYKPSLGQKTGTFIFFD
jgi:hypothetical protein